MARFKSKLNSDLRYQDLIIKVGNKYTAKGMMTAAFELAQQFWLSHKGIPENKWPSDLNLLIEIGLAKQVLGGDSSPLVYVCGSAEENAWLIEKQRAGRSKSPKKLAAVKKNLEAAMSQRRLKAEMTKHDQSSLLLSPSSFLISNPKGENTTPSADVLLPANQTHEVIIPEKKIPLQVKTTQKPKAKSPSHPEIGKIIGVYVKTFQERYNTRPLLGGKVQGQLGTMLKDHGFEQSSKLLQAYLQMDGEREWFKTKSHDIGTFMENLNQVQIAVENGHENSKSFNWDKIFSLPQLVAIGGTGGAQ